MNYKGRKCVKAHSSQSVGCVERVITCSWILWAGFNEPVTDDFVFINTFVRCVLRKPEPWCKDIQYSKGRSVQKIPNGQKSNRSPADLLHTPTEVIKKHHSLKNKNREPSVRRGDAIKWGRKWNKLSLWSLDSIQKAAMQSFSLINVKSKSSQPLNEVTSEVDCYSESSSIQLSHFTESLKRFLIGINLQEQQNHLLL